MFVFVWLDLVELDCADGCLVWVELPQFVEGDDFLILDKTALFRHLFGFDIFRFLVLARARSDFFLKNFANFTFLTIL